MSSKGREAKNFETLLQLTAQLTEDRPLEDFLQAVTDALLEVLEGEHSSIRLLDTTRAFLMCGARSGAGGENQPLDFRRGEGILGWVVEKQKAVNLGDATSDHRWLARSTQGFDVQSLIAEPLWSSGEVIGVLAVSSPKKNAFDDGDQLMLRLLANCCAPPIERARLQRLAMYDGTTMAFNHRYLQPRIVEEMERATRSGGDLSIATVNLDGFKWVKTTHGAAAGDAVLRLLAERIRQTVRRVDVLVRTGGDDFVLLMPLTGATQAHATGQRIQQTLAQEDLELDGGVRVRQTVSVGIATWDRRATPEDLLLRAAGALREAKRLGKNRVVVAGPA